MAMIKSNGYGHGLLRIAQNLPHAQAFGVACLEEALILRDAGIKNEIVVMAGFYNAAELPLMIQHHLTCVIHQFEQIEQLKQTKLASPLSVWLKIDTGMHRLGFPADKASQAYQQLLDLPNIQKPISLMTHLADADNSDNRFTHKQIEKFSQITAQWPGKKSIVNSAGIIAYPQAHADFVRPGILLFGVSPFANRTGAQEGLKPVMTLSAKIMEIKDCQPGDAIGYGCAFHCTEPMRIGIVGIGYGDGYPRHVPNGTPTLVNEKICPLVGRVSMDMVAIDLRDQPKAKVDDPVILWGGELPVEKIASYAGTIGYELLCGVTARVKFIEVNA